MTYRVVYSKHALKDISKLKAARLDDKAKRLIELIKNDPFSQSPPYEKLVGDLQGTFSRRINIKHRLVYEVFEEEMTVRVLSMWSHYEGL